MNRLMTMPRSWPKRYHMMAFLLLALLLCYIDRVLISLAAIEMQKELGWSNSDKGFVLSSFFMGYLIMQLLGGILSNRYGGRNIFLIAVVLWSLFTILTPVAAYISFAVLLLARFMLGVGEGAAYPAAYNLIHGWMCVSERSRAVSMIMAAAAIGTVFALLVTGSIIERFGWPSVFYLFGSIGLIWSLFWIRAIPSVPVAPEGEGSKKSVEVQAESKRKIPWKLLLTHRVVLNLYLVAICAASISYTLASWLPSYFVDTFGSSLSQAGIYSIFPWCVFTVVTILAGAYADKAIAKGVEVIIVRKRLVLIGALIVAACLGAVAHAEIPIVAVIIISGVFSGIAIITPGYAPIAAEVMPDHGEILYGFMAAMGSVGSSIIVALTGVLLEKTGSYDTLFNGMAILSLVALVSFQLFAKASPIAEEDIPMRMYSN